MGRICRHLKKKIKNPSSDIIHTPRLFNVFSQYSGWAWDGGALATLAHAESLSPQWLQSSQGLSNLSMVPQHPVCGYGVWAQWEGFLICCCNGWSCSKEELEVRGLMTFEKRLY